MTDNIYTVLNPSQFGGIKHRIDNSDLVGLLVAQHLLKKLYDSCRIRITAGDNPKPENQPELDLDLVKAEKFKPGFVSRVRSASGKRV